MAGVPKSETLLKKLSIMTALIPFFIAGTIISMIMSLVLAPRLLAELIMLLSRL